MQNSFKTAWYWTVKLTKPLMCNWKSKVKRSRNLKDSATIPKAHQALAGSESITPVLKRPEKNCHQPVSASEDRGFQIFKRTKYKRHVTKRGKAPGWESKQPSNLRQMGLRRDFLKGNSMEVNKRRQMRYHQNTKTIQTDTDIRWRLLWLSS